MQGFKGKVQPLWPPGGAAVRARHLLLPLHPLRSLHRHRQRRPVLVAAGMFATRHYDRATRLVALGLAGSIALAVLTAPVYLGGLFTDLSRAPEVASIEVVVGGVRPCSLSLAEVGAGVHHVHLIAELHPVTVRILAADGQVVLQATAVPQLPRGSRGSASRSRQPMRASSGSQSSTSIVCQHGPDSRRLCSSARRSTYHSAHTIRPSTQEVEGHEPDSAFAGSPAQVERHPRRELVEVRRGAGPHDELAVQYGSPAAQLLAQA